MSKLINKIFKDKFKEYNNTYAYFNIPCNSFVHITTNLSAPPDAKRLPSDAYDIVFTTSPCPMIINALK